MTTLRQVAALVIREPERLDRMTPEERQYFGRRVQAQARREQLRGRPFVPLFSPSSAGKSYGKPHPSGLNRAERRRYSKVLRTARNAVAVHRLLLAVAMLEETRDQLATLPTPCSPGRRESLRETEQRHLDSAKKYGSQLGVDPHLFVKGLDAGWWETGTWTRDLRAHLAESRREVRNAA